MPETSMLSKPDALKQLVFVSNSTGGSGSSVRRVPNAASTAAVSVLIKESTATLKIYMRHLMVSISWPVLHSYGGSMSLGFKDLLTVGHTSHIVELRLACGAAGVSDIFPYSKGLRSLGLGARPSKRPTQTVIETNRLQ